MAYLIIGAAAILMTGVGALAGIGVYYLISLRKEGKANSYAEGAGI